MRGIIVICSFLALGMLTAFYIAIGFDREPETNAIDYEVEGLNEKYIIRFTHVVAKNTPKDQAATYFAQLVKEKTDGWVEVQVFPNGALYRAQEEFEALKKNEIQMIAPGFAEVAVHDPKWNAMDLPYLFKNEETYARAFEGKIGELLFESIEKKGYKPLAYWDNGFRQMINNIRPVIYPEDIEDLTMRVMPSEALFQTYRLLRAKPVEYPFNEVYAMLNARKIDGTENTLSNIYSKGFDRDQKYLTISNHNYLGYVVLMNPQFWSSLPIEYQTIIEESMVEATTWVRMQAKELNDEMLTKIQERSDINIHYLSDDEKEAWRKRLKPIYNMYESIVGEEIMKEIRQLQASENDKCINNIKMVLGEQ